MQEVIQLIKNLMPDGHKLCFGTPVTVKKNPHSWPIKVSAVKVAEENLWTKYEGQEWQLYDGNEMVLNSISQRLKSLQHEAV